MARYIFLLLSSAAFCAVSSNKNASQVSLEVAPQSEFCMFEELPAGVSVEATVLTYRGGKLDIGLRIEAPPATSGSRILYEKLLFANTDDRTGAPLPVVVKKGYKWKTTVAGEYSICLNNKMARWTSKVCTIDFIVSDGADGDPASEPGAVVKAAAPGSPMPDGVTTAPDDSAAKSTSTLRQGSRRIGDILADVYSAVTYHRTRTNRHHNTLLSTEARVSWWTIAESLVLSSILALQMLLVTRWFATPGGSVLPVMGGKKNSPLRDPPTPSRGGLV
jgi:hypothetical protein